MALLFRNHPVDMADVDSSLVDLARRLRAHRGDAPAETMLWERIDALLDQRLRLGDVGRIADSHEPPGS